MSHSGSYDSFHNAFKHIPMPACLIDKSSSSLIVANYAFETGLGFSHNKFLIPAPLYSTMKKDSASNFDEVSSTLISVGMSKPIKLGFNGKFSLNSSYTFVGCVTLVDNGIFMLSGSFSMDSIPKIKHTLSDDEKSAEDKFVEEFPLSRDSLIDLFQNAAIGVLCTGGDGEIIWANRFLLTLLGYEPHEFIGQVSAAFLENDDDPELIACCAKLKQGEMVYNVRVKMRAKSGEIKYLMVDTGACFHSDGSFSHSKTFIRDDIDRITEEITNKEIKQRLEDIAVEKDRFIRLMFHELRTPLNILSVGILNLPDPLQHNTNNTNNNNNPIEGNSVLSPTSLSGQCVSIPELKHQVSRLVGLMDDLSFVVMFDSDNVVLPRPVLHSLRDDLHTILQTLGISYTYGSFVDQTGSDCRFKVTLAEELPPKIMYDRSLQRVLSNMLNNAVKYCSAGGVVEINVNYKETSANQSSNDNVSAVTDTLTVTVTNSVTEALDLVRVNKLFQNYLKMLPCSPRSATNSETSESGKSTILSDTLMSSDGLGLGLYVSYNLIQSLGGLLECSSTSNEACFWFTLPIPRCPSSSTVSPSNKLIEPKVCTSFVNLEDLWAHVTSSEVSSRHVIGLRQKIQEVQGHPSMMTSSPAVMLSEKGTSLHDTKKLGRILVVDDSPICRKVLVRALEANNYSTDCACDGQEACQKMSVKPCLYSAVLMDLRMPIMDGITATKLCKSMEHAARVPIIIVTAEMGEEIRSAAMDAHANCFLNKPVLVTQLLTTLEDVIVGKK